MSIYDYEAAFGAADKTSRAMRTAISQWFSAYYDDAAATDADPCQRIGYTLVSKLNKTVFGEYAASCADPAAQAWLRVLDEKRMDAMQLALVGGECYIKPCPVGTGFSFTLIPRNNVLVFARDADGLPTDMGTVERCVSGKYYYTLLERRSVGEDGRLTIENKLLRSLNDRNPGSPVRLNTLARYAHLPEKCTLEQPVGLGLVRVRTPILNCVDGSADGVAVYAPAMGLIRAIDENEAQLRGEFRRGKSRIIVSRDLLDENKQLSSDLFVGLDEDPDRVGITLFSPQLREQSFLARKQEYLRNVESVIGLKRGTLSDVNMDQRTATEVAASAADYNLTVMELQRMWQRALEQSLQLCAQLAGLYGLPQAADCSVTVDWGNGVLYDEDVLWQGYLQMVKEGLLKPEIALGWRFGMAADTAEQTKAIREKFMP